MRVRIACPVCSGGGVQARDVAVRLPGRTMLDSAVVGSPCASCDGTGWLDHPGNWKAPHGRGKRQP